MIRNKEGDNTVENIIMPKYKPVTHHLWNIAYKGYSVTGFREEWREESWIVEQLSCEERKLSRTLQGWKTDGRGGYSRCLLNCVPGRGWLQNDCSQALSVQESKDVSWSYEMADAEQTQEDDPLEKVSVCSGISCHSIWMLEVSICSRGNWIDLWNKYQVGVTKYIGIPSGGLWAAMCWRPGDCFGEEGSLCA